MLQGPGDREGRRGVDWSKGERGQPGPGPPGRHESIHNRDGDPDGPVGQIDSAEARGGIVPDRSAFADGRMVNDETLHLTAADAEAIGPKIKYMPEWKAFGWFTAKDSVEWDVDVPSAGEYNVQMEWSVSDEDAGKEFILIAEKDQLTGIVDKSGSWETYKMKDVGSINLDQGKQKLIFRSNTKFDEGAILDLRQLKLEKK